MQDSDQTPDNPTFHGKPVEFVPSLSDPEKPETEPTIIDEVGDVPDAETQADVKGEPEPDLGQYAGADARHANLTHDTPDVVRELTTPYHDAIRGILAAVQKNGGEVLGLWHHTHPGAAHLWIVIASLPTNEVTPFVVWNYNADDGGLFEGGYASDLSGAVRGFDKRMNQAINRGS